MGDSMDYYTFYEHAVGIERIKWTGSQGIGLCPIPAHDDTQPSFSFHRYTGLWNCFGCGWKGNAYTLAVRLNKDNPRQYIDSSTMDSKKYRTNRYEPNNDLKSKNKQAIDPILQRRQKENRVPNYCKWNTVPKKSLESNIIH